jgi:hypothetical protein
MTVKFIRFISGENVVADLTEETAASITISDAIVAVPANQEGTQLGFVPFAPLQDPNEKDVTIAKSFVMFITKLSPELEEQYNNMFNRIATPTRKLIM